MSSAAPAKMLSPPQVATRYRVKPSKVVAWIVAGRLRAINVSNGSRPRYRIDPVDLAAFEQSRQVVPRTAPQRKGRKQPAEVIEFY